MAAIGSLVFCTDCGDLLDNSGKQSAILICSVCGTSNKGEPASRTSQLDKVSNWQCKDTSSKTVITRSKPSAFPSSLRTKRSEVQTLTAEDMNVEAVIRQTCDKCGREEVRFTTQQLRSADEGTTVFYSCECGNRFAALSPANFHKLTFWSEMEHQ